MTAATATPAHVRATTTMQVGERLASAVAVVVSTAVVVVLLLIVIAGMAPASPVSSGPLPGQTSEPASLREPLPVAPVQVVLPTPGAPIH